jgi:ATP-dependent DNA helicase RecG
VKAAAAALEGASKSGAPARKPGADARLEKLGIRSKLDRVLHLPLRYEDETKLTPLADARPGEPAVVEAEVVESKV